MASTLSLYFYDVYQLIGRLTSTSHIPVHDVRIGGVVAKNEEEAVQKARKMWRPSIFSVVKRGTLNGSPTARS